jgi:LEA14-like dessication related protein
MEKKNTLLKKKIIAGIILIFIPIISCKTIDVKEYLPKAELYSIKIQKFSLKGLSLITKIKLINQKDISIPISKNKIITYINNSPVLEQETKESFVLKPKESKIITFYGNIKFAKLKDAVKDIFSKKYIDIGIKTIIETTGIIKAEISYTYQKKVELPKINLKQLLFGR